MMRLIALWLSIGVAIALFGTPVRFWIGLWSEVAALAWFALSALYFIALTIMFVRSRTTWVGPTVLAVGTWALCFGWPLLDAAGDRAVFEARRPLYERAVVALQNGAAPEAACAEFRWTCGVSRRAGLAVAFYHPEFFDKFLAYVYDPSGRYRDEKNWGTDEMRGDLVLGVVLFCRPLDGDYYRCFFS